MSWRIGREYVGMRWDVYLGSVAICKKTVLERGSSFVDVDGPRTVAGTVCNKFKGNCILIHLKL
jgi:hypothetical protein